MRVSGFKVFLAWMTLLLSIAPPGKGQTINCTCRYQGVSYNLNTCVCIDRGDGPQLACCGMVLNNTSWSFTREACPVALTPQTDKLLAQGDLDGAGTWRRVLDAVKELERTEPKGAVH